MFDVRRSSFHVTFEIEAGARLFHLILNTHISYPEVAEVKTNPKFCSTLENIFVKEHNALWAKTRNN